MQCFRFACVVIASCVALGCSQVVGDYSVEKPGGGSGGTNGDDPGDLPRLPALPDDDWKEKCEACVIDQCDEAFKICVASERCRDMLRCTGKCSDPNCIVSCTTELPPSPYFQDYFACAFTAAAESASEDRPQCAGECNAGSNWACVGAFTWKPEPSDPIEATVQLYDRLARGNLANGSGGPLLWPSPDAEIAACKDGSENTPPTGDAGCSGWTPVGAYGHAVLDIAHSQAIGLRGGGSREHERIYARPVARSGPLLLGIFRPGIWGFLLEPSSPKFGVITAFQLDCLTTSASADIQLSAPGEARRCWVADLAHTDCEKQYGSLALFVDVEPKQAVEITSWLADERQVSRATVLVAPGSESDTAVLLYPMSRQDAGF